MKISSSGEDLVLSNCTNSHLHGLPPLKRSVFGSSQSEQGNKICPLTLTAPLPRPDSWKENPELRGDM